MVRDKEAKKKGFSATSYYLTLKKGLLLIVQDDNYKNLIFILDNTLSTLVVK